tara:strand:- start:2392 stop:2634 length:243 start_codon:yes stop_codon:yes gene_type:complete
MNSDVAQNATIISFLPNRLKYQRLGDIVKNIETINEGKLPQYDLKKYGRATRAVPKNTYARRPVKSESPNNLNIKADISI